MSSKTEAESETVTTVERVATLSLVSKIILHASEQQRNATQTYRHLLWDDNWHRSGTVTLGDSNHVASEAHAAAWGSCPVTQSAAVIHLLQFDKY